MSALEVAADHARSRARLAEKLRLEARDAWARVDPARISESWLAQIARLLLLITGGQHAAAATADRYVNEVLVEQDISPATEGRLDASALAGVASDGRALETLLAQPAIVAKVALANGATIERAMAAGGALAELIAHTQVADAGRVADQVALTARRHTTGYVRMIVGDTCSRCIVLAGRWYRWNAGFSRHPKCDCIGIPAPESAVNMVTDPRLAFEALSSAEQDEAFGKAGAQAVREGADMARVVNARRGMQTAGGKQLTTEATTSRGTGRRIRLMPEQIYQEASGDRNEVLRLLRKHGYITGSPAPAPAPRPRSFDERAAAAATGEKAVDAPAYGLDREARPDGFTEQMYDAVNRYSSSGFHGVNRYLRGQRIPHGHLAENVHRDIAGLDAAMAASSLDRDILTYRGLLDGSPMFGARLEGDLTGMQWREDAYVSTTADEEMTVLFSVGARGSQRPMLLRILTPAGTPAVQISDMQLEAEVLLGRGLRLRVVADLGIDADGIRHIDAEVLRD